MQKKQNFLAHAAMRDFSQISQKFAKKDPRPGDQNSRLPIPRPEKIRK